MPLNAPIMVSDPGPERAQGGRSFSPARLGRSTRGGVLFLGVALSMMLSACSRPVAEPEPVRSVRTVTVTTGTAALQREFAAEVRARTETRLSFRVGGKLVDRPVELGQTVRAGQVLARLDPEDLRQGQEAARAALSAAQANLDVTSADLARFTQLRDQGFISQAELDRRQLALKSAQAQVDQARAQAAVQRNQALYSTLTAPQAGVVTAVDAEPGQVLAAGMPVLRLAVDGPREVQFAVPEDSRALLASLLGKTGALRVRLWDGSAELPATLRELAASADSVTRTFQARADLGTAKVQLGQTATVHISLPQPAGVIKLPLSAVVRNGASAAVWVVDAAQMTVQQKPVQVMGAEGSHLLVAPGLPEGAVVVTAGVHVLTPGQKVRLYEAPPGAAPAAPAAAPAASASR